MPPSSLSTVVYHLQSLIGSHGDSLSSFQESSLTVLLHCALSLAAQCIAIGPVCLQRAGGRAGVVCLLLYGSVTTITRNCIYRSSSNWVCR